MMSDENIGNRRWSDQPDFLHDAESMAHFFASPRSFQVMKRGGGTYYLTVGNLFGSQTIRVGTADEAFKAIDVISGATEEEQVSLKKHGWELMHAGAEA